MVPTDRISGRAFQMFPYDRRRKSHRDPISSWVTVVAVAATVVSCVAAFSSNRPSGFVTVQRTARSSTCLRPSFLVEKRATQCLPLSTSTRLFSSNEPNSDKEEWRALISAFQMYKAAYGDLKVPSRFVVPSMPPWPESAWEMKLGQKVAAIRATGKYVQINPKRRKSLESLGFVWRVRAASQSQGFDTAAGVTFDQLYDALVIYRKEVQPKGALTVPSEFVVPNQDPWPENTRGLPLGMSMSKIQSKSFLKDDPDAEDKLNAIGVQMDSKVAANDTRFQNVCDGLKRYKEIHGDMLVPQPFIVPENSNDWPEDTWGLRLGARVNAIRSQGTFVKASPERKKQLDDLGFVWVPPQTERRKRGRKSKVEKEHEELEILKAQAQAASQMDEEGEMEALDSLFGNSFDFGTEPLFPDGVDDEKIEKTWGFEGGKELQAVVAAKEEAQQQAEDDYKPEKDLAQKLAEAAIRAEEVGIIGPGGGGKNMTKGKRHKDIPWFNDDFGGEFVFEDVVEALTLYQSFYGDFSNLTNEEFVIPVLGEPMSPFSDDDDDSSMFEFDASSRAAAAIARFEKRSDVGENLIEAESARLSDEVETETAIAVRRLEVKADWPEHLQGMLIGNIVKRIRDGSLEVKHLPERKAKLDAIAFDWGDPKYFIDIAFEKAMCAMYAYYLVRGDMFVREDFIMLDEDPWPQALAGYELGLAVKRIRELQNFFEAYHNEKVMLLRMIDFVWFPTLAFPIDPNEPEMTPERLMLSACGHPDYTKMREVPMGLPEKILGDGPFFETDDPRMRWKKWHNWDYVKDYWYQWGRRDNGHALRVMGYPVMAAEHEEKYGPGLFAQIEGTMDQLQDVTKAQSPEERKELVEKLKFYGSELIGCRDKHPEDIDQLIEDIDVQLLELLTGEKSDYVVEKGSEEVLKAALEAALEKYEEEEVEEYEEEEVEEEPEEEVEEQDEEEYDEEEEEEEDLNIEDELGLDST